MGELIQLKTFQQASDKLMNEINKLGREFKENLQMTYESFIDDLRTSKTLIDFLYLLYFYGRKEKRAMNYRNNSSLFYFLRWVPWESNPDFKNRNLTCDPLH